MGGLRGWTLLLLVSLVRANFSPTIDNRLYEVCEDTPIGSVAFTIEASDPDGDSLTFTLQGNNAGYFEVDRTTGVVKVKAPLDAEAGISMRLGVTVSDGPNTTPAELVIILKNTNDNKPIFRNSSLDTSVPENTPIGDILLKAVADDLDGNPIRYKIDEVSPVHGLDLFEIDQFKGELKLKGRLNYTSLSTFYRLKITVYDEGHLCYADEPLSLSSSIFSFITVVDVPDLDPLFIGTPYVGTVEENSPVDLSVFKVTAIDQDTGINDAMVYSIEDSTSAGLFKISAVDGLISVSSGIDRETVGDTVTLTVKATEANPNIHGTHASTTTTVQVNILDINDNPPEFYKCGASCEKATEFTGEVFEHSLAAVSINMTVKDPDKSSYTELTLEGVDKDVFSLEPSFTTSDSVVQLRVRQPENLDYEKKEQMVLQVIAIDKDQTRFSSTATVTVNIIDTNDNSPTFPNDTYKLMVAEHSPVGTNLTTITAEDPDTMDQGKLTYRLLPESILPYFDVDEHTGRIFVKSDVLLDREVRSLYSATLQARDSEGKPGSTVLEITLTDINDQAPVINRPSYREFVKEGEQLEFVIEATDGDEPGTDNSRIQFHIEPSKYSSNFTIDEDTGLFKNKGELDREALDLHLNGRIELNVTATDKGTPPLSSTVPVIIIVEDVNDNAPIFEATSYSFSVKEGEKGAFVGSVHAEDLDQTKEFNRISFSIVDGSFGSFTIRSIADARGYKGNISVDQDVELDYETTPNQFNLRVEAADLEQEKASVVVNVNVLDVNDERPEFKPTAAVTVKENTTITEPVGKFVAQDKDTNHSLIYGLESVKCMCNGSLTPCAWFILDPDGNVRVNPAHTVDYEECVQAVIEAQVVDEYTEKGENNSMTPGQMVINIEDINDNAPQFIHSDSVFVVVSEGASKGTSVARVTASDLDSGINRQMEFKVNRVQFEDRNNHTSSLRTVFEAVTTQQNNVFVGIIQTTEGLDLKLQGKYLVTVTATDTGGLETSTVVEIFTVDDSYKIELEFSISKDEVEKRLDKIIRALMTATDAAVEVLEIKSASGGTSRAEEMAILVVYFIYPNGTALASTEVEKMISDPQHFPILKELGLINIGDSFVEETTTDPWQYILLGIVGGLVIVLLVLVTSLMCTRRNYQRKLKAAKAMNTASMVTSENQKGGAVVPGTNKYTMEGANPVLNLHIDTTLALDIDGDSSDEDKVSLNSLDDNSDILKDSNHDMEEKEDGGPLKYKEPQGSALDHLVQKKGPKNQNIGFINPIFDTTDL